MSKRKLITVGLIAWLAGTTPPLRAQHNGAAPLIERLPPIVGFEVAPSVGGGASRANAVSDTTRHTRTERPRVGVVLGGGGAAGVCHVGVLKVLEQHGIPIDCIAGTSMGSIVAGLYATGLSTDELEKIVSEFRWNEVLVEPPAHDRKYERRKTDDYLFPPAITVGIDKGHATLGGGFVSGQNLTLELRRILSSALHIANFDQLPIPFRTVATDLETGEQVVFRGGNLATAIRASMSIPGVFPPVRYADRLLIDGGVRNNVPMDLAREMGADILIVVRIPANLKSKEELNDLFSISSQSLTIMSVHGTSNSLKGFTKDDILIEPNMNGIGSLDFHRAKDAVACGEVAAHKFDRQLAALSHHLRTGGSSVSPNADGSDETASHAGKLGYDLEVPTRVKLEPPDKLQVDRIAICSTSPLATDASIAARLTVEPHRLFTLDQMEDDLARLRGTGNFGIVDYEIGENEFGGQSLDITTTRDSRGETLLTLGLGLEDNFSRDSAYNASASLVYRGLNKLGGEARLFGQVGSHQHVLLDFFQPIEQTQTFFVRPFVSYQGYIQPAVPENERVADFLYREYAAGGEGGRIVGDYGVVAIGAFAGESEFKIATGSRAEVGHFESVDQWGAFYVSTKYDRLDNYFLPKRGVFGELAYTQYSDSLNSAGSNDTLFGRLIASNTLGPNTLILRAEGLIDDLFAGERTDVDSTTGGFLRLSGYAKNQIFASKRAQATLVYLRHISSTFADRVHIYYGASGELAYFNGDPNNTNVVSHRPIAAGSAFAALETPLGPIFVGYGMTDTDEKSVFFAMGQVF